MKSAKDQPFENAKNENGSLKLREAAIDDFEFLFSLRSEANNLYWTGHDKAPDRTGLLKWFTDVLQGEMYPNRKMLIINDGRDKIGYFYLDKVGEHDYEVSVAVSERHSGKGYATKALAILISMLPSNTYSIIAWILEDNLLSQKLFVKNGFVPTDDERMADLGSGRTGLQRKYVLKSRDVAQ